MTAEKAYRVLVPIDFSECSRRALQRGVEEVRLRGGKVTLLHVVDLGRLSVAPGDTYPHLNEISKQLHREAAQVMEQAREGADPGGTLVAGAEITHGVPAETILNRASRGAYDLIVIGTRGET